MQHKKKKNDPSLRDKQVRRWDYILKIGNYEKGSKADSINNSFKYLFMTMLVRTYSVMSRNSFKNVVERCVALKRLNE
jgi:hypothetical protein